MTELRDEIAKELMSYLVYPYRKTVHAPTANELADAILALPEMKKIIEANRWREFQKELMGISPEQINEWKEKAEALDNLEYGFPQEVEQALKKVRGK